MQHIFPEITPCLAGSPKEWLVQDIYFTGWMPFLNTTRSSADADKPTRRV